MTATLPDEAARFLALFGGSHTFQTFDDSPTKDPSLSRVLHNLAELANLNAKGAGVFMMVNAGDGQGRKTANVINVRAYCADFDGAPLPQVWQLHPSLIVETSPGKFHVYWILWEVEAAPLDRLAWNAQQEAIARAVGSQPDDCKGLNRVMRLPGYLHQKGEPFTSRIVSSTGARFTLAQIPAAFPLPIRQIALPCPDQPTGGYSSTTEATAQRKYALSTLHRLADELSTTTEGGRNNRLNAVSYKAGRLVGGGHLERSEVEAELTGAALHAGLSYSEIRSTLHNGLMAGMADPDPLEQIGHRITRPSTMHHTISSSGATDGATFSPSHQPLGSGLVKQRSPVELALGKYRAKLGKKVRGLR